MYADLGTVSWHFVKAKIRLFRYFARFRGFCETLQFVRFTLFSRQSQLHKWIELLSKCRTYRLVPPAESSHLSPRPVHLLVYWPSSLVHRGRSWPSACPRRAPTVPHPSEWHQHPVSRNLGIFVPTPSHSPFYFLLLFFTSFYLSPIPLPLAYSKLHYSPSGQPQ